MNRHARAHANPAQTTRPLVTILGLMSGLLVMLSAATLMMPDTFWAGVSPMFQTLAEWTLKAHRDMSPWNLQSVDLFRALLLTGGLMGVLAVLCRAEPPQPMQVMMVLLVLAGLIAFERWDTYAEAYERDLMVYAVMAQQWLEGRSLYADLWDHKPPLVHWTYAGFMALFGDTPMALFMMGLSASWLTLGGVFACARLLSLAPWKLQGLRLQAQQPDDSGRFGQTAGMANRAGLVAGLIWSVVQADLHFQANQPNVEVFMNAVLIWMLYGLLRIARGGPIGLAGWLTPPLLLLAGTLYKPIVLAPAGLVMVVLLVLSYPLKRPAGLAFHKTMLGRYLIMGVLMCVAVVLGWLGVYEAFRAKGAGPAFIDAVFTFNQEYSGSALANILSAFEPWHVRKDYFPQLYALVPMLMVLAFRVMRTGRQQPLASVAVVSAYLAGAAVAVAAPGKWFAHYYQLLLPAIALLGALLLTPRRANDADAQGAAPVGRPLMGERTGMALVVALALPLALRSIQVSMPLDVVPVWKYSSHGEESLESIKLGAWIQSSVSSHQVVYHWGAEPGIYFWSRRAPPTGLIYNYPIRTREGTKAPERVARQTALHLKELEKVRPEWVIANTREMSSIDHDVERWILENYVRANVPVACERFEVYRKKP